MELKIRWILSPRDTEERRHWSSHIQLVLTSMNGMEKKGRRHVVTRSLAYEEVEPRRYKGPKISLGSNPFYISAN